jgi:hypothetical protein
MSSRQKVGSLALTVVLSNVPVAEMMDPIVGASTPIRYVKALLCSKLNNEFVSEVGIFKIK